MINPLSLTGHTFSKNTINFVQCNRLLTYKFDEGYK